jgi:hypothetical protein
MSPFNTWQLTHSVLDEVSFIMFLGRAIEVMEGLAYTVRSESGCTLIKGVGRQMKEPQ